MNVIDHIRYQFAEDPKDVKVARQERNKKSLMRSKRILQSDLKVRKRIQSIIQEIETIADLGALQ